jgi:hypothetical protein
MNFTLYGDAKINNNCSGNAQTELDIFAKHLI